MEEKKVKLKGLVKLIGLKGSIEKLNAVFVDEDKAIMPTNYYNQLLDTQVNWIKLKKFVEKDIKYWEEQEKEWIKLGFMKFGGEANNKIIFKKILNKMEELENKNV